MSLWYPDPRQTNKARLVQKQHPKTTIKVSKRFTETNISGEPTMESSSQRPEHGFSSTLLWYAGGASGNEKTSSDGDQVSQKIATATVPFSFVLALVSAEYQPLSARAH
jgi:hypothetical protein